MPYKRPGFEIEAGHGGAIAMLMIPDEMADFITSWGKKNIDDEEVYGKDGKGRDGSPHVTLQNGIMCDDSSELERLFSEFPAMPIELGPISVFRNAEKDYDVVHIQVLSDALHDANSMVSDLLEVNDVHPEYKPHITLAYVKKGAGDRFEGLEDFVGKDAALDRMVVDGGNIKTKTIQLSEAADERAAVTAKKKSCSHSADGKGPCGRCELLKDSLDYGQKVSMMVRKMIKGRLRVE